MATSRDLQHLYDHRYFHGETSGYPESGYPLRPGDWGPWVDILQAVRPSGTFIDVGCAYGSLIDSAGGKGYLAFGLDVSDYALSQVPELRPRLIQAHAQHLPLGDQSADVITLFDVLEHLEDPLQCLAESVRALKPDGLLAGATPDPIFFERKEETHIFERPPAFWVTALRQLGLTVQFRLSVEPYNFQFLASFPNTPAAEKIRQFQHDFFGESPEIVKTDGPITALPRFGWGRLEDSCRSLAQSTASIYLLNLHNHSLRLRIRIRFENSPGFSVLRIRLNSYVLEDIHLSSEQLEHEIELPEALLPAGGHHLFFDLFPGGPQVKLSAIEISAAPAGGRELVLGLPFDLYQRYRLAADAAQVLCPGTILDVGGYIGDQDGHLAVPGDFFHLRPEARDLRPEDGRFAVSSTDIRQCDHWAHTPGSAWDLPFEDDSFDLVLSLDVLEHLPGERRELFLSELDRVSRHGIILGAPFASEEVRAAEDELSRILLSASRFLKEHEAFGLPETSLVQRFFKQRDYSLQALPSGYIPRWKEMQILTQHYFSLGDYQVIQNFNCCYNQHCYSLDQCPPAYRTLFVISKHPLTATQEKQLRELIQAGGPPRPTQRAPGTRYPPEVGEEESQDSGLRLPASGLDCRQRMTEDPRFIQCHERILHLLHTRSRTLQDVQFLSNESGKLVEHLETHIANLKTHSANLETQAENLRQRLEEVQNKLDRAPLWRIAARRLKRRMESGRERGSEDEKE